MTPLHASPGRFSNLSLRGRACWASFCDPCVAPYASPSHSPSQRSLDRACVASFVEVDGEVHAVIELRGDGFLHGQPEPQNPSPSPSPNPDLNPNPSPNRNPEP